MASLRGLLIGAVALSAASASAASIPFVVRPGLWLITVKANISGMPSVPPSVLAHMTPAQRAQMQARLNAAAAAPTSFKSCVTPEQVRSGFDLDADHPANCIRTIVDSSATSLTLHIECKRPRSASVGTVHFQATDASNVQGVVNMTVTTRGHAMTVQSQTVGKWLGADCGNVRPHHAPQAHTVAHPTAAPQTHTAPQTHAVQPTPAPAPAPH